MQAEQQSELLPCPFCLTSNVSVYPRTCDRKTPYDARDRAFPVARCACGASMDGKDWGDEQTAIDAWNRRAALSHPSPMHEAVQAMLKARDTYGWSVECDEKINALRGLSHPSTPQGWQPIESAPKDDLVLVWSKGAAPTVANRITDAIWTVFVPGLAIMFQPHVKPDLTHWMPLPPPPEQGGKG